MSLFDNRYFLYPNGDLVVCRIPQFVERNVLQEKDRKKSRFFQLSYQKYRLLASAASIMSKTAENKLIFLTFTFNEKLHLSDVVANQIWNRFIKNFKKTYDCKNYVGVLEHTENGTPHYHFIADFPFADIRDINQSWINSIITSVGTNHNFILGSIRLPEENKSVVDDTTRAVRYLCKYFAKGIGVKYQSKCYFISRGLRELSRAREITAGEFERIETNLFPVKHRRFEHCSVLCYKDSDIEYFWHDACKSLTINQ